MLYGGFWSYWELYHKCVFDGPNKKIYISPEILEISVKDNIYSEWKEWVMKDLNARFTPAIRVIGGDSLGSGLYAGDLYFLMNSWQIVVDHFIKVSGVLYNDIPETSPYIIMTGGGVISTVSNLVQTAVTVAAADNAAIAGAVWSSDTRTLTTPVGLTSEEHDKLMKTSTKSDVINASQL